MNGQPRKDGCPRCLCRDNEPKTWDDTTGKATYRCHCGNTWATWWEHASPKDEPSSIGDLTDAFLANLSTNSEGNPR